MADNAVNITYETLFEIIRLERNREEIQQLDTSFFINLLSYLREKQAIVERDGQSTLFSAEEKESTLQQLNNIKKIVKELYERREKKIINMALNRSRTQSNIIDPSALLDEEKMFFESLVSFLDRFRKGIILNILHLKEVNILPEEHKVYAGKIPEKETVPEEEPHSKMVRFIHAVPKFVGTNLEIYGPYEEEDMANLPTELANVLLMKKRVEEVKK